MRRADFPLLMNVPSTLAIVVAGAVLMLSGCGQRTAAPTPVPSSAGARPIIWVLQGQANDSAESLWAAEHKNLGELVRAATDNAVDITYVSDAVPDTDVLNAVKARKLNLGFMGVQYQTEVPLMNFQLLPIVPNDRLPEILALLKPRFGEIWEQRFGVKLLAFSYYLPQLLYTTRPADTLKSLGGQRIRQFGPDAIRLYTRAGAKPVEIKRVTEVLPKITDGTLDGAQSALPAYVNWGWAGKLKYISNWPLGSVYMALVVNMDDWRSLTPELQSKLVAAAEELEKRQWNGRQASIDELVRQAGSQFGARVVNPPQAEVDALLANIGPILDDWKKQVGPDSALVLQAVNKTLGTSYQ
jgi:TRAP-type C4-dicarboxylate transport system substrate-binding protein